MNRTEQQLRDDAVNVLENVEDTVEHICDEYMLSGEKVWVMINARLTLTEALLFPLINTNLWKTN